MYIKNLSDLTKIHTFKQCSNACIGLYTDSKRYKIILDSDPLMDTTGSIVGFSEVGNFESMNDVNDFIDSSLNSVFKVDRSNASELMISYSILQDFIYAPFHKLIQRLSFESKLDNLNKYNEFNEFQGTNEELTQYKNALKQEKMDNTDSFIMLLSSLYQNIKNKTELSNNEQQLFGLMCMLDTESDFSDITNQKEFLRHFVPNKSVLNQIGLPNIQEYFSLYNISRDYFSVRMQQNLPIMIYTESNDVLLTEKNELFAWRSWPDQMKKMLNRADELFFDD